RTAFRPGERRNSRAMFASVDRRQCRHGVEGESSMRRSCERYFFGITIALCAVSAPRVLCAQLPLAPLKASGQTVTPAFEGWYKNPDGTYSISFGYYNRNTEEALDIPVGPDNFIAPGNQNQG